MARFKVVLLGHGNANNMTADTDDDQISKSAIAIKGGRHFMFESVTFSTEPDSPHVILFREAEVCSLDTPA